MWGGMAEKKIYKDPSPVACHRILGALTPICPLQVLSTARSGIVLSFCHFLGLKEVTQRISLKSKKKVVTYFTYVFLFQVIRGPLFAQM
jgi:hypothetical protein